MATYTMNPFSKKIPARDFVMVTRRIAAALREPRDAWVDAMTKDTESGAIRWRKPILAGETLRCLSMLQLSVVACCFKDRKHLSSKEATLLLEWVYELVASDVPCNVRAEIERFRQYGRPDEKESVRRWAKTVAPLIAEPDAGQAQRQLEKWLPFVVRAAMIATYETCGDTRAARRLRVVGANQHWRYVPSVVSPPNSTLENPAREASDLLGSAAQETRHPARN